MADQPHYYGRLDNEFLDSLELSVRADRVLRALGTITSLDRFMSLTREDVMAIKGAGRKTWNEIAEMQRYLCNPSEPPEIEREVVFRPSDPQTQHMNAQREHMRKMRDLAARQTRALEDISQLLEYLALQKERSLRDAAALAALASWPVTDKNETAEGLAQKCWTLADAFIAAREAKTDG